MINRAFLADCVLQQTHRKRGACTSGPTGLRSERSRADRSLSKTRVRATDFHDFHLTRGPEVGAASQVSHALHSGAPSAMAAQILTEFSILR